MSDKSVSVSFDSFATEHDFDVVTLYEGIDPSAKKLGEFSGSTLPPIVAAPSGQLLVQFRSDRSIEARGFDARWMAGTAAPTFMPTRVPLSDGEQACTIHTEVVVRRELEGWIRDGSAGERYGGNWHCEWVVRTGTPLELTFAELDLERTFDLVKIYDGSNVDMSRSRLLGQFSGSDMPPPQLAMSGSVYVVFVSDGSISGDGFALQWHTMPVLTSP